MFADAIGVGNKVRVGCPKGAFGQAFSAGMGLLRASPISELSSFG